MIITSNIMITLIIITISGLSIKQQESVNPSSLAAATAMQTDLRLKTIAGLPVVATEPPVD